MIINDNDSWKKVSAEIAKNLTMLLCTLQLIQRRFIRMLSINKAIFSNSTRQVMVSWIVLSWFS